MPASIRYATLVLACLLASPSPAGAEEKRAALSFGGKRQATASRGFGGARGETASRSQRATERDESYARGLLKKYDANGDSILQKAEWEKISGTPEKADSNRDGKITYNELLARVTQKRREREASGSSAAASDRRSYRLMTAQEKLPEGLPSWFEDKDRNGDGQVSMSEYSRRWTDSTARRFIGMDKNDDGLITPDEALKGR